MIVLQALASLALRFALALPFWKSGLTRWEGFLELRPATALFLRRALQADAVRQDLRDPLSGDRALWVASSAEIILPAALVIGFATRISALGLLIMTGSHLHRVPEPRRQPRPVADETLPWAAMALALIAYGPGLFSVDRLIWSSVRR